jgi:polysaccharide pyruvyl transferase WcaK-like protein
LPRISGLLLPNKDTQGTQLLATRSLFYSAAASCEASPRIALLTPYTGGNLGDGAIQDAMITNLRLRLPKAQFSGISLDSDNYLQRHGTGAFPLCASGISFYGMSGTAHAPAPESGKQRSALQGVTSSLKAAIRRVPGARGFVKTVKPSLKILRGEFRHCVGGYHFLRRHDLVVVCGGGQLDEEWGGPWGHPLALFKWAVLSKLAGVPYVVASVGACKTTSRVSRFFVSAALRMARYRSYRDKNSREIAAGLFARAMKDSVVPDLAFSLHPSELTEPAGLRAMAKGRAIVAISPIVYAKPGHWPFADPDLYARYLDQLAELVSQLLRRGSFLVFVWSARSDKSVLPEIRLRLDEHSKRLMFQQTYSPELTSWKDLLAVLQDADFLIASRLHSTIFGFLAQVPLVAISFDPKVDWAMQDLRQTESLLQIRNFTVNEVLEALARLELRRNEVVEQFAAFRQRALQITAAQFDALAQIAMTKAQRPH